MDVSLGRLKRDVRLYGVATIGPAIVGLANFAILTRLLGEHGYGSFVVVSGVALATSAILGDWLTPVVIRLMAGTTGPDRSTSRAVTLVGVAAAALSGVVTFALATTVAGLLLAASAAVLAATSVGAKMFLAALRLRLRTKTYTAIVLASSGVAVAAGVVLYRLTESVAAFLWGASVPPAMCVVCLVAFSYQRSHARTGPTLATAVKSVLSFGLPIALTAVGGQALQVADRYIIAVFSGEKAAGMYAGNYVVGEKMVALLFGVLFAAVYPLAAHAWSDDERPHAVGLLSVAAEVFGAISIPLIFIGFAIAPELVSLLSGSAIDGSRAIVALIGLGNVLWFSGILFHQPLELERRTILVTKLVGIAAVTNLALNMVLVPAFGAVGAATATFLSYGVYCVLAYRTAARTTGYRVAIPWSTLVRMAMASVAVIAITAAARTVGVPWWAATAISCVALGAWLRFTRDPLLNLLADFVTGRHGGPP